MAFREMKGGGGLCALQNEAFTVLQLAVISASVCFCLALHPGSD